MSGLAARWSTVSHPVMADFTSPSSFKSPRATSIRASLALSSIKDNCPELKLSNTTTRSVAGSRNKEATRWLPMKPAPPETKTRFQAGAKSAGTSDNAATPGSVNLAGQWLFDRDVPAFAAPRTRGTTYAESPAGRDQPEPGLLPDAHRPAAGKRRLVRLTVQPKNCRAHRWDGLPLSLPFRSRPEGCYPNS